MVLRCRISNVIKFFSTTPKNLFLRNFCLAQNLVLLEAPQGRWPNDAFFVRDQGRNGASSVVWVKHWSGWFHYAVSDGDFCLHHMTKCHPSEVCPRHFSRQPMLISEVPCTTWAVGIKKSEPWVLETLSPASNDSRLLLPSLSFHVSFISHYSLALTQVKYKA